MENNAKSKMQIRPSDLSSKLNESVLYTVIKFNKYLKKEMGIPNIESVKKNSDKLSSLANDISNPCDVSYKPSDVLSIFCDIEKEKIEKRNEKCSQKEIDELRLHCSNPLRVSICYSGTINVFSGKKDSNYSFD